MAPAHLGLTNAIANAEGAANASTGAGTPPADEQARLFGLAVSAMSMTVPQWRCASAWTEHAPFAFWLVEALAPRLVVELGSHHGYSFFVMCQAVEALGLASKCVAIDTWQGDRHAGFYSDRVWQAVKSQAAERYAGIAALKRMTFDAALPDIAAGSIDLLHIDGRHFYDDVKHDFESWRPKLSDRAVVLFHDTQVVKRDFGVHRLWSEIRADHPSFEFRNGFGLGVLGVGSRLPERMVRFFEATRSEACADLVRDVYKRFADSIRMQFRRERPSFQRRLSGAMRGLIGGN